MCDMKKLRIVLPLLVPFLSLIYACGDYYSWWDNLRGRKTAAEGVQRLASPDGLPDIIIFDDEAIFEDLLKLILHKTENHKVTDFFKNGKFSINKNASKSARPWLSPELACSVTYKPVSVQFVF